MAMADFGRKLRKLVGAAVQNVSFEQCVSFPFLGPKSISPVFFIAFVNFACFYNSDTITNLKYQKQL